MREMFILSKKNRVMFRKFSLACFFLLVMFNRSTGQDMNMDAYINQLLFNVFKERADTSITGFLKRYIPALSQKKKTTGGQIMGNTLHYRDEIHSFIFTQHPFFHGNYKQGKLEFFYRKFTDPKQLPAITDVQLWFDFDNQAEAEIVFSRLVDMFILVSTHKKFSSANGAQKAEFMNATDTTGFNKVRFRLTTDHVAQYRYKILLETTNDL